MKMVLNALHMTIPKHLGGVAESVVYGVGSEVVKVDVPSPTDEPMQATRPDVVIHLRESGVVYILDVACAWEGALAKRIKENSRKYQPLAADVAKQWKLKARVIPVVFGVLGTVRQTRQSLSQLHFLNKTQITSFPYNSTKRGAS